MRPNWSQTTSLTLLLSFHPQRTNSPRSYILTQVIEKIKQHIYDVIKQIMPASQ